MGGKLLAGLIGAAIGSVLTAMTIGQWIDDLLEQSMRDLRSDD